MSSSSRPRTTKPRGVCSYYTTPRGCLAGSSCKFLHGVIEELDPQNPLLTPYDEAKRCRFYAQGFCRRGDQCWFKHIANRPEVSPPPAHEDLQNEPCSICFEKPVTYGLLSGCSHIFCITCIRQWRDQKGQTEHGNIKKCPMCREPSRFITPSSCFWRHGHPEKDRITKAYKDSMSRIPCRYFQKSLEKDRLRPLCPFGRECFYQHLHDDGTPHIFRSGPDVCMRQYFNATRPSRHSMFDEFMELHAAVDGESLSDAAGIFSIQLTADVDALDQPDNLNGSTGNSRRGRNLLRSDPRFREQLRILWEGVDGLESAVSASNDSVARALDMVRTLVQRSIGLGSHHDHTTEGTGDHTNEVNQAGLLQNVPISSLSHPSLDNFSIHYGDFYDTVPGLQTVSTSSSSEAYLSDSDSESDDDISRLGRYLRSGASIRSTDPLNDPEVQHGEDEEARMMQEIADRGPEEAVEVDPALVAETDEPQIPVMDYETPASEDEVDHGRVANPPFLTDGRGRVVWSSDGEVVEPASSEPRPSAERVGENPPGGESQAKRNGTSGL